MKCNVSNLEITGAISSCVKFGVLKVVGLYLNQKYVTACLQWLSAVGILEGYPNKDEGHVFSGKEIAYRYKSGMLSYRESKRDI